MNQPTGLTPGPANPAPFSLGAPLTPSFDVADTLPKGARAKLHALRERAADAHALTVPFEEVRVASELKQDADRVLRRLTDHRSVGGHELEDTDGRVIDAKRTLDKATANLKRLQQRQEAKSQAWQAATAALQRIERWLRDEVPPGNALRDHAHAMPKLDGSIIDAIADRRRQVTELKADLATIAAAPHSSAFCKQQARMQIARLAAKGTPSLDNLIGRGGDIEFAQQDMSVPVVGANWTQIDALATLVWLHRDQLLKKLDSEIDAASDDGAALDADERQRRESETRASLLACERDLAALIWEAQRQHLPVDFPADIAPIAILSVQLASARPVEPMPGSSFDHALSIIGLR